MAGKLANWLSFGGKGSILFGTDIRPPGRQKGAIAVKDFAREDLLISLCGLCCGLCPMQLGGHCPGCGGGPGNQPCAIARCSGEHGGVAYCSLCAEYPCRRYAQPDPFDSFVTHRNRRENLERVRGSGAAAFRAEQEERRAALDELLAGYNDGRRKTFFCLACNLLECGEIHRALARLREETSPRQPLKERAALAVELLEGAAARQGVTLKLRRKPREKRG